MKTKAYKCIFFYKDPSSCHGSFVSSSWPSKPAAFSPMEMATTNSSVKSSLLSTNNNNNNNNNNCLYDSKTETSIAEYQGNTTDHSENKMKDSTEEQPMDQGNEYTLAGNLKRLKNERRSKLFDADVWFFIIVDLKPAKQHVKYDSVNGKVYEELGCSGTGVATARSSGNSSSLTPTVTSTCNSIGDYSNPGGFVSSQQSTAASSGYDSSQQLQQQQQQQSISGYGTAGTGYSSQQYFGGGGVSNSAAAAAAYQFNPYDR